jgi:hypothetical protein
MTASDLKQLLEYYKHKLPEIIRETERSVVEWRWATDLMVSCEPLHHLVKRQCRYWRLPDRRWVAREDDAGPLDATLHGFDCKGQLRLWRHRNAPAHYLIYGDDVIDEVFDSQVFAVTRYCLQDTKIVSKYEVSLYGFTQECFERIGSRYVGAIIRRCAFRHKGFEGSTRVDRRTFTYDENGDLDRVVSVAIIDGLESQPELLFVRPRGETLAATLHELEELLVAQIPESIRLRPPDEPVYCIAIVYCGEDFFWPTTICLGTESLRERLLMEEDPQWRHKAIVPGEWGDPKRTYPLWPPSAHERAIELQLRAFQLIDAPDIFLEGEALRPARELLQRVAARLTRIDWGPIMPLTEDFIAYMIDDTGDFDSREDIRASVPADRIAILRDQGYRWL